ncbi:hypothetical protein PUR29_32885 [Methylobacterium ajmalii]|uniref:Uncharacterized protein n=1 Tax=Methylobacterium ajmalii TaxID=2738439 RepID=A0ABV0A4I1_9HYPH
MLVRDLCGIEGPAGELMQRAAEVAASPVVETERPRLSLKKDAFEARRDEFLDLYANTDITQRALAQRFGFHQDTPRNMLRVLRTAGDERVKQGDVRRAKGVAPQAATQGGNPPAAQDEGQLVQVLEASDERAALGGGYLTAQSEEFVAAPGAGEAIAVADDPAPAPDDDPLPVDGLPKREPIIPITKPKREPPPKPAAVSTQIPLCLEEKPAAIPAPTIDTVITVQGHIVVGPTGQWRTSPQIARTLAPLAGGALLGFDRLQKAGGWSDEKFVKAGITAWTRELKEIGVTLIRLSDIGIRLVRREID